jgi:hypothetical protein
MLPAEYVDDLYVSVRVRDILLDGFTTGTLKYFLDRLDDFPFLKDLMGTADLERHPASMGAGGFAIYKGRHNSATHE